MTNSEFPSFLLPIVPETHPRSWIVINNLIAVSGCVLLAEFWYAKDHGTPAEERPFAEGCYLIWEFAICLLWVMESGLSAFYQHASLRKSLRWYTQLELGIAVYFAITTALMLGRWNLTAYDASEIWYIVMDASFYIYLAMRSCLCRGDAEREETQDESPLDGDEGSSSYKRMNTQKNDAPPVPLV